MRPFNIPMLRRLVAPTEEQDDLLGTVGEVDAVSRAVVDPQFEDAAPDRLDVSRIPDDESRDPDLNPRLRTGIPKSAKPPAEDAASDDGYV